MPGAEKLSLKDAYPQVHDRTQKTPFDAHYFYFSGWAMLRILQNHPVAHVDIGSAVFFSNLLSAVLPVIFIDYRPLEVDVDGLDCLGGDVLNLPLTSNSVESLSCLHVAEHIGLGRYGEPVDHMGSLRAARELSRVMAPGGNLYFVVPIGKPKVNFNAHRIHSVEMICEHFSDLKLVEISGVHDNGVYVERAAPIAFKESEYACGMFIFKKEDG